MYQAVSSRETEFTKLLSLLLIYLFFPYGTFVFLKCDPLDLSSQGKDDLLKADLLSWTAPDSFAPLGATVPAVHPQESLSIMWFFW